MTRGYFLLKNPEKNSSDPYLRASDQDILMEAYHTGQFMLRDILFIPINLCIDYAKTELAWQFREPTTLYVEDYSSFDDFHEKMENRLIFDLQYMSLIHLLHMTSPFKYNEIDIGVTRYGASVTEEDVEFEVEFNPKRNEAPTRITFPDEDNEDYDQEIIEETIKQEVEEVNGYYEDEQCKVKVDDRTIKFDMLRQIYYLIYYEHYEHP